MNDSKSRYEEIVDFIKEVEQLKNVTRTAHTSNGRHESTAEHSWRLSLLTMCLSEDFPECDPKKLLELAIIHDLGELYCGDVPAILEVDPKQKESKEYEGISKLVKMLPEDCGEKLDQLWNEYNAVETKEAKLIKTLDKIETIIQHNQGANPKDFNYEYNLNYGKKLCNGDNRLLAIRALVDADTKARMEENK